VNSTGGNTQWTCASLDCSGTPGLEFAFSATPSTTTAPLNVTGDVTFTATPQTLSEIERVLSITDEVLRFKTKRLKS
jgi:hypothetical protein